MNQAKYVGRVVCVLVSHVGIYSMVLLGDRSFLTSQILVLLLKSHFSAFAVAESAFGLPPLRFMLHVFIMYTFFRM